MQKFIQSAALTVVFAFAVLHLPCCWAAASIEGFEMMVKNNDADNPWKRL